MTNPESAITQTPSQQVRAVAVQFMRRQGFFVSFGEEVIAGRVATEIAMGPNERNERFVRCPRDSQPMSLEERKRLGVPRGKYDRSFWDALSEKGRKKPIWAAQSVFYNTLFFFSNVFHLQRLTQAGCTEVMLSAPPDGRTCKQAVAIDSCIVDVKEAALPLPECDALWCRCMWLMPPRS